MINKVPLKWNQLLQAKEAKEKYDASTRGILDSMLKRTLEDLVIVKRPIEQDASNQLKSARKILKKKEYKTVPKANDNK